MTRTMKASVAAKVFVLALVILGVSNAPVVVPAGAGRGKPSCPHHHSNGRSGRAMARTKLKHDDDVLGPRATDGSVHVSNCTCVPASLCRPLDTPHPSREIFGAYIHDRTIPHLNYSGLTTLFIGPPATLDPAVICAAHAHGVRVVSSVGFPGALLGPPGVFNPAYAATPAARASWVRHVMYGNGSATSPGVATAGLDGVMVDIEKYTGNRSALTALIAELAVELKTWHLTSQLSFALSVVPGSQSSYYDHVALSHLIDYIFVMAYDEWPFEAWPKGTKFAAANSDLRSLHTAVAEYRAIGVAPHKLVIGLPWYVFYVRTPHLADVCRYLCIL